MKVLVTGREGQLVRSLIERAAGASGIEIVASGRPELDLGVPGSAAEAIRAAAPDAVINAAAYTAVDLAEDEPERAMRINGDAAGEVAAAAARVGAPVIQVSTDYVFDGAASVAYAEDSATGPIGAYGRSKLMGEARVRRENPRHLILRTAWVYSPFGANFVKTMMRLAEGRDVVRVVSDQRGNPSSALDLADGMLVILERWAAGDWTGLGQVYHLAGTGSTTWAEFADTVFEECRAAGVPAATVEPISTAEWPTKAARPANSMLDSSKFAADFRYSMPDWRQSVRDTVRRLASETAAA